MNHKIAITFQQKYKGDEELLHSVFPEIRNNHFLVIAGEDWQDARSKAFILLGSDWACDYDYEIDGVLDPDFQRQIEEYGLVEFVPEEKSADIWYV